MAQSKPFFFFKSISHTATDDTPFNLIGHDLWFRDINIHVVNNAADYGDLNEQEAEAAAGSVLSFRDVNLFNIWFKNSTAGSNTTIRAVGVLMSEGRKQEMEVV